VTSRGENGGMLILGTDKVASINPFGSVLPAGATNLTNPGSSRGSDLRPGHAHGRGARQRNQRGGRSAHDQARRRGPNPLRVRGLHVLSQSHPGPRRRQSRCRRVGSNICRKRDLRARLADQIWP
jgi:hypothetical protein